MSHIKHEVKICLVFSLLWVYLDVFTRYPTSGRDNKQHYLMYNILLTVFNEEEIYVYNIKY